MAFRKFITKEIKERKNLSKKPSQINSIVDSAVASLSQCMQGSQRTMSNIKKFQLQIRNELAQVQKSFTAVQKQVLKKMKKLLLPALRKKLLVKHEAVKENESQSEDDPSYEENQSSSQEQDSSFESDEESSSEPEPGIVPRRRYAVYDQEFKEEVCAFAKKLGTSHAADKYKLTSRKVLNWLEAQNNNLLGKGRKALDPVMEFNLCIWILRKIWEQVPLTQKVIREKGATMKTLKKSFNGSKGWLQKFFLRHVELKSCFDYRSRDELKVQCARYHFYAYKRIEKDLFDFLKSKTPRDSLIKGDIKSIIYFGQDHPLLRLKEDRRLDRQRKSMEPLFKYQEMLKLSLEKMIKLEEDNRGSELDDSQAESQSEPAVRKRVKKEEQQSESESDEDNIYQESSENKIQKEEQEQEDE